MTPTNVWQKAFLGGQSTRAVDALHSAWQDLVTFSPETFCSTAKEPVLTEILCEHLAANRTSDRLTGMWSYEVRQGRLVRSGKRAAVVDRKRTDIRYFTDSESPALDLIFEFKRIDHRASRRKYYTGEEGIMRFVTGDYSVGQPVALMVGILTVHHDDCVPPLEKWLNSPDGKTELQIEPAGSLHARRPSMFTTAAFDTVHSRVPAKAPAHGTIVVAHMFLGFPAVPRRVVSMRTSKSVARPRNRKAASSANSGS